MNRNNLNTEDNFWPCVSDMFLAFFVIALALYATSNSEKGKGDEYISSLAREEAIALVEHLHRVHPNEVDTLPEKILMEKDTVNSPGLAQKLYELTEMPTLHREYFNATADDEMLLSYIPEEGKNYNLRKAACLLYSMVFPDKQMEVEENGPRYHQLLREVRERIQRAAGGAEGKTKEELIALLNDSVPRSEKSALEEKIKRMEREKEILKEQLRQATQGNQLLATLQQRIQILEEQLQEAQKQLAATKTEIDGLKDEKKALSETNRKLVAEINRDNRKSVMDEIEKLLKQETYQELVKAGIELLKDEGVIRIPESVVGFDTNAPEPRDASKRNLKTISNLLREIGEGVTRREFLIDNISIECHADPTGGIIGAASIEPGGKKRKEYKMDNDWLSMLRALAVWKQLEKERSPENKLADYKNKDELGLFSTSGFGSRVPVKKKDGETAKEWYSRCRRMDIRINCSPEKMLPVQK